MAEAKSDTSESVNVPIDFLSNVTSGSACQTGFEDGSKINCLVLREEGMEATAIHKELVATLRVEAVDYPSVTAYLQEARLSPSISLATYSEPNPEPDDSDNVILLALGEQPFVSVR
jgi:hypothetical protein